MSPSVVVAGAALVAVLAVAGLVAGRAIGGSGYPADGAAPGTLTVDGVRLTLDAQVPVLSVTPAPGRPSLVVVDVGPAAAEAACATYAAVRVAEQDEHRVRLAAYRYQAAGGTTPDGAIPDGAIADGAAPASACADPGFAGRVTVDLGAPLAGRRVVEDGTDRVLVLAG